MSRSQRCRPHCEKESFGKSGSLHEMAWICFTSFPISPLFAVYGIQPNSCQTSHPLCIGLKYWGDGARGGREARGRSYLILFSVVGVAAMVTGYFDLYRRRSFPPSSVPAHPTQPRSTLGCPRLGSYVKKCCLLLNMKLSHWTRKRS